MLLSMAADSNFLALLSISRYCLLEASCTWCGGLPQPTCSLRDQCITTTQTTAGYTPAIIGKWLTVSLKDSQNALASLMIFPRHDKANTYR